ncbi:hypothetical protein L345_15494 [Ophiophagus hannah]|uniref:Uncharacterized protein n=1 Tax=Ophiophagus hannah TaxID=8665 RepID=V8NA04_OPHHA|nr:hypothetical protein L345_15494 [Ophiophagus hannah]
MEPTPGLTPALGRRSGIYGQDATLMTWPSLEPPTTSTLINPRPSTPRWNEFATLWTEHPNQSEKVALISGHLIAQLREDAEGTRHFLCPRGARTEIPMDLTTDGSLRISAVQPALPPSLPIPLNHLST